MREADDMSTGNTGEFAVAQERPLSGATAIQLSLVIAILSTAVGGAVAFTRVQADLEHQKTDVAAAALVVNAQIESLRKQAEEEKNQRFQVLLDVQQIKNMGERTMERLNDLATAQRDLVRAIDAGRVGALRPTHGGH